MVMGNLTSINLYRSESSVGHHIIRLSKEEINVESHQDTGNKKSFDPWSVSIKLGFRRFRVEKAFVKGIISDENFCLSILRA